jgi:hypothetical protein
MQGLGHQRLLTGPLINHLTIRRCVVQMLMASPCSSRITVCRRHVTNKISFPYHVTIIHTWTPRLTRHVKQIGTGHWTGIRFTDRTLDRHWTSDRHSVHRSDTGETIQFPRLDTEQTIHFKNRTRERYWTVGRFSVRRLYVGQTTSLQTTNWIGSQFTNRRYERHWVRRPDTGEIIHLKDRTLVTQSVRRSKIPPPIFRKQFVNKY